MNHLTIGDRQHNALLAAIQLWQKISLEHPEMITEEIARTAAGTDGGSLDYDEMNELCRGINDGINCVNSEFKTLVGGFHVLANHLDVVPVHPDIVVCHDALALYLNAVQVAGLACGDLVLVETESPADAEQADDNV